MKICYLADAASIHTQKWIRFFADRDHEVHVVSFQDADISTVTFHRIEVSFPLKTSPTATWYEKIGYLFHLNAARKLVRRLSPDILHAHWATSYGLMGALSNWHPFILSTWGSDVFDFPRKSFWHKRMIEFTLRRADDVTATSRMLADETKRYMSADRPVHTIPFGVDIDRFRPQTSARRGGVTVGIVKKLEKKYGVEHLIRAFATITSAHPEARLLIVGDGSEEMALRELARQLGIEKSVIFAGFTKNDRVPYYLHQMDVFVVPSVMSSETFGVAAVEAAACGLPVIASDIGGLPEVVIDGQTGFLVPPAAPAAIAEKLLLLIENLPLRRKMGEAARKFVERNYIWEKNAGKMEKLYRSAVERTAAG